MRSLVQVQDGPYLYVGGIAQLVERLLCKQDVVGSNPSGSTMLCWKSSLRLRSSSEAVAKTMRRRRSRDWNDKFAAPPGGDAK